jgi:hypothetical protein
LFGWYPLARTCSDAVSPAETGLPTFVVLIAVKLPIAGGFPGISPWRPVASVIAVFARGNESAAKQQGKDQPDECHGVSSSIGP